MKNILFPQKAHTQSRYHDRFLRTAGIQVSLDRRDVTLAVVKKNGIVSPFEITLPNDPDTLLTLADALATIATKNSQ